MTREQELDKLRRDLAEAKRKARQYAALTREENQTELQEEGRS